MEMAKHLKICVHKMPLHKTDYNSRVICVLQMTIYVTDYVLYNIFRDSSDQKAVEIYNIQPIVSSAGNMTCEIH